MSTRPSEREAAGPPSIDTVPSGIHRPYWSVMIPTYNCAHYLRETLASVLAQDPGPAQMQIEVVDDASTRDDPEAVVREMADGRVTFFRQPQNVGITENFNTCVRRSVGRVVHLLHGDDMVVDGFFASLQSGFEQHEVGAAFCRYAYMDEDAHWIRLSRLERRAAGVIEDWISRIAVYNWIQAPSIVVRRDTYEQLGGYHPQLFHAADWEMWRRIASRYAVWYEPRPLACYRVHTGSDTSDLVRSGRNLEDIRRSIEIARSYLPQKTAHQMSRSSHRMWARYGLRWVEQFLRRADLKAAYAQICQVLKCDRGPGTLAALARLMAWALWKTPCRIMRRTDKNG